MNRNEPRTTPCIDYGHLSANYSPRNDCQRPLVMEGTQWRLVSEVFCLPRERCRSENGRDSKTKKSWFFLHSRRSASRVMAVVKEGSEEECRIGDRFRVLNG